VSGDTTEPVPPGGTVQGLRIYPGWSQYERRAPNRRIAVFVLEPVTAGT
jgi:hypothetical protein